MRGLPDDEQDTTPTLSRFRDKCVYFSSFRVSQRDMFESVKRVTKTTDADWAVKQDDTKRRYEEGKATAKQGSAEGWMKMGYSRIFFADGAGDYESSRGLHNEDLGLTEDNLYNYTEIAVQIDLHSEP